MKDLWCPPKGSSEDAGLFILRAVISGGGYYKVLEYAAADLRDRIIQMEEMSKRVRVSILNMIYQSKSPHIGPSFSIVEILIALYFDAMNISPHHYWDSQRDRFILSKGHACPALYAVLAERGFIDSDVIKKFAINDGLLEQHPKRDLSRGIEVSTGSLGHGLSISVGMALTGRVDCNPFNIYILLGDGELNEGSVWEAIMFAGHHCLNNIIAIVDYNKMQALGFTKDIIDLEPLAEKWKCFNWSVQQINGHNFEEIINALNSLSSDKPNCIILDTVKGKGVSFMENELLWHYRCPDEGEYYKALQELEA